MRRYETAQNDLWFEELSRRPHTIQTKTVPEMEQLVVNIRRRLEKTSYAQIGAITIQWEIKRLGQEPPPVWTINRILKKLLQPLGKFTDRIVMCSGTVLTVPNFDVSV